MANPDGEQGHMSYMELFIKSKINMKSHTIFLAIVVRLPFEGIPFILTIISEAGIGE